MSPDAAGLGEFRTQGDKARTRVRFCLTSGSADCMSLRGNGEVLGIGGGLAVRIKRWSLL